MTEIVLGSGLFTAIVLALALTVIGARAILLPSGTVAVTVNTSRRIAGQAGRKLLGILTDAGIPVPSPCGGVGRCGLCRVIVKEGGGEPYPTEIDKISRHDLRQGVRLACQITARDPVAVEVPDELFGVETWDCTVVSSRNLTPFIKELVLALPAGERFTFTAGAFIEITAPPFRLSFGDIEIPEQFRPMWDQYGLKDIALQSDVPVTRAYSLANRPTDDGKIVMNVRLALPPPGARGAKPGLVSSYLIAAKPGDRVTAAGPYGTFRAQETGHEMVFIGGGVGMAPLRAIIFDQLERRHAPRKISFWYGARSPIELFYVDEFDALQRRYANFSWTVALSDPVSKDGWDGEIGFIHNVVYERYLKNHPAPEECEYYLCGPPLMIRAVDAMLDDLGVEGSSIFFDDFGS